eukprot:14623-Chlamydomonas_euryale.AAC.1
MCVCTVVYVRGGRLGLCDSRDAFVWIAGAGEGQGKVCRPGWCGRAGEGGAEGGVVMEPIREEGWANRIRRDTTPDLRGADACDTAVPPARLAVRRPTGVHLTCCRAAPDACEPLALVVSSPPGHAAPQAGSAAAGEVYAAATKSLHQMPTLPAAHNALGLAAEARGHPREAAKCYETALQLLLQGGGGGSSVGASTLPDAADSGADVAYALAYLGVGTAGARLAGGADATAAPLATAVRLNLARALSRLGAEVPGAAACAVAEYERLDAERAMGADAYAWLSYAAAIKRVGEQPDGGNGGSSAGNARIESALRSALA